MSALGTVDGGLVICFDQLERIAETPDEDGAVSALSRLLRDAVALCEKHPNVSCIVSALPEVADAAVGALPGPDQQRIRGEQPFTQPLRALASDQVEPFFIPRFEYLAGQTNEPAALLPIRSFARWITKEAPLGLSPRLLLHAMHRFGHHVRFSELEPNSVKLFDRAWNDAIAAFSQLSGGGGDEIVEVGTDRLDALWQRVQVEAPRQVVSTSETADLVSWSLSRVAANFADVSTVEHVTAKCEDGIWVVRFVVRHANAQSSHRAIYLCDAKNYAGALVTQIETARIASARGQEKNFVFRPFGNFENGPSSMVRRKIEELRRVGGIACDLLPAEVLNMSQLRMLSLRVDQTAFNVWTQQQAALVPSLHRAVSPP